MTKHTNEKKRSINSNNYYRIELSSRNCFIEQWAQGFSKTITEEYYSGLGRRKDIITTTYRYLNPMQTWTKKRSKRGILGEAARRLQEIFI